MSKLNSIESLMDGYNPQRQLLEQTRQLVSKWEPTGLLEGIEDETKVHGMAVLLENQAGQLIQESSVTGGQNAEEWSGVALPLVRRIFGELAAQEFVSVQPMNLPSGLVFYLDFKYGTGQPGFSANSHVFGVTSGSDADPNDGLYGAGKFGYSINDKSTGVFFFFVVVGAATCATSSATWKELEFEPSLSQSVHLGAIRKVNVPVSAFTRADFAGIKAFEMSNLDFLVIDKKIIKLIE